MLWEELAAVKRKSYSKPMWFAQAMPKQREDRCKNFNSFVMSSGKRARAGLFHTGIISMMAFSLAIIWNKRSTGSLFYLFIFKKKYFIQSDSVFIGVHPSWASGFRPSSPGLPAEPKPVHRGVCPEQTRGDSPYLSVWLATLDHAILYAYVCLYRWI